MLKLGKWLPGKTRLRNDPPSHMCRAERKTLAVHSVACFWQNKVSIRTAQRQIQELLEVYKPTIHLGLPVLIFSLSLSLHSVPIPSFSSPVPPSGGLRERSNQAPQWVISRRNSIRIIDTARRTNSTGLNRNCLNLPASVPCIVAIVVCCVVPFCWTNIQAETEETWPHKVTDNKLPEQPTSEHTTQHNTKLPAQRPPARK